jgi:hypothetical protein
MITHAGDLSTEKTLCGLTTGSNMCGWVFTEKDMKLDKGQMHSLFENKVSCEACLRITKETRFKNVCEKCGKEL